MAQVLTTLENDAVAVKLYDDGSAEFVDKATNRTNHMARFALQDDGPIDEGWVWLRRDRSMCETYPGHFEVAKEGSGLRVTLHNRVRAVAGTFHLDVRLDGPWVEFALSDVSPSLPSLVYPPPLEASQLVLPSGVGRLLKQPLKARSFWRFWAQLNMRFFGGLEADGEHGWIAVYDAGHADAGVMLTELAASPGWLQSLGKWPDTPRRVRYRFTTGGYVGIAKTFRAWAKDRGIHKSLEEKIAGNKLVANFVGGRLLSFMQATPLHPERFEERFQPVPERFRGAAGQKLRVNITHAQAQQMIRDAFGRGMTKGMALLRGWINGGYDESHPDIWPPEPALGTVEELRALCDLSGPGKLTVGLHDNYQDIYLQSTSFPRGVNVMPDGSLMPGGLWAGGQAFILNSRDSVAYLKRNWAQMVNLHPRAMFIDTTTAVELYQSYEKGNTQTRAQDESYKSELLAFLREQGMVVGSEESSDFGIRVCDWMENRHTRVPGESVPLWPLVFHDAIFCGRYTGNYGGPAQDVPPWLTDMLWGYFVLWGNTQPERWPQTEEAFKASLVCDRWHQRIGTAEMTAHRYLTEDGMVEQTEFAPGLAIACNFGPDPVRVDGVEVPGAGYLISE